uniref:UPAR/Ly6 domain-containing protein n=1 Tax=Mola mola TaxID=94237 RepID=A0A3Q3XAI8_MOLML
MEAAGSGLTSYSALNRDTTHFFLIIIESNFPNNAETVLNMFVCFCQALECYKCSLGIGSLCITSKTTCKSGEQCFSGVGEAASVINIKMKGCLPVTKCNMTEDTNFPSSNSNATVYSMTKMCCNTNLCNAAPGLPGASALSLALASISALLVARVLV